MNPLRGPASLAGRGLQRIARGGDMPALRGGEEVEIFGLAAEGCRRSSADSLSRSGLHPD
jgi:hypothetical protein